MKIFQPIFPRRRSGPSPAISRDQTKNKKKIKTKYGLLRVKLRLVSQNFRFYRLLLFLLQHLRFCIISLGLWRNVLFNVYLLYSFLKISASTRIIFFPLSFSSISRLCIISLGLWRNDLFNADLLYSFLRISFL